MPNELRTAGVIAGSLGYGVHLTRTIVLRALSLYLFLASNAIESRQNRGQTPAIGRPKINQFLWHNALSGAVVSHA